MNAHRHSVRVALTMLVVALLLGLLVPALIAAEKSAPPPAVHVVKEGETLWELSQSIAPERDPREVVHEIQVLNGLGSARLFPGQKILLPSG